MALIPAVARMVLEALGYDEWSPIVDQIWSVVAAIGGAFGLPLAAYGRVRATTKIE